MVSVLFFARGRQTQDEVWGTIRAGSLRFYLRPCFRAILSAALFPSRRNISCIPVSAPRGWEQPQTGAKRVIPGKRSKSVSALAKLVIPGCQS
jgi:hypothetical protein